jgi:6-phosphogluconolactonase
MGDFQLLNFKNPEDLTRAAALDWLKGIPTNPVPNDPYCVALSGGRIAGRFFSTVAGLAKEKQNPLALVDFFWGDERCVPPNDPESNFWLAQQHLLAPLNISQQRIHRIPGEKPPELAVAEAAKELLSLAPRGADGQPVLDLIFLGMGEDGHVASLFPGEPHDVMASAWAYRAVTATKPPPRRITLGFATIAAARQVWVLASGPGKEKALRQSLAKEGTTPLAYVLKSRPHTRIFSDLT